MIFIGMKPSRGWMLFYGIQGVVMGLAMGLIFNIVLSLSYLFGAIVFIVLFVTLIESYYISTIKYWYIDHNEVYIAQNIPKKESFKHILSIWYKKELPPTFHTLIDDIESIEISAKNYSYMFFRIPEPNLYIRFNMKDGSEFSMFAGDNSTHQGMIRAIQYFQNKNIRIIDPYHLCDDLDQLYTKLKNIKVDL